jgi:hypothetical protein
MKNCASRSVNLPMTLATFKHFSCLYEVQLAISTIGTFDSVWPPHFDQVIPANLFR